jgi:glyoxylase-like metal-dependent hydrolase (beta-lactamase superfamily II)
VILTSYTVGPFQENCYLVGDDAAGECVLIDPGDAADRLVAAVERSGTRLSAIWLTHAHLDHIGAIAGIRRRWDVPIHLHPLDEPLYRAGARQAAAYGLPFDEPPLPDRELAHGDRLAIGSLTFEVIHTPGHAPGHVTFLGAGVAFVGDCLFLGSIGRTDLPLSNAADMERSLETLASLPPETLVYAGHGPATTIGYELRTNPFLNGAARIVRPG